MHTALTRCTSSSKQPHPESKIVQRDKFFPMTASSNVLVSRQAEQFTAETADAHSTDRVSQLFQSIPPRIQKLFNRIIFFYDTKFKCLGVSTGLAIHCTEPQMHMGWKGCRIGFNPAHLWIQTCSEGQIFASQQGRMSGSLDRLSNSLPETADAHGSASMS